jgi:hypothetical protein
MKMKKLCTRCNLEKDVTLFHRRKRATDGYQSNCKLCCNDIQRIRRGNLDYEGRKNTKDINLIGVKKEDYCNMYLFLSKMGYNIEGDIHSQFCEKWSIIDSKQPRKGIDNAWSYEECQE